MEKSQCHIILAEDEVINALSLACDLRRLGFRVTVTHDGCQALLADVSEAADVLLTDLHMPRLGGEDLIRCLRARRPDLPVIVVTGQMMPPDLLADPHGLTICVSKPISDYELISALRLALSSLSEVAIA